MNCRWKVLLVTMLLPLIAGVGEMPVPDHSPFDRILAACVRGELVNYNLISTQYRLALFNYLASMAGIDPALLPQKDQLAYYINVYNATMLHEVVQRRDKRPDWKPSDDDFAVFKEPVVTIGQRKLSLNDLENNIIRPTFNDPRIHAALVCAARSCPPLLNRAYRGDDLEEVLNANMKRFVLDRSRNPIDDETRQLKLSKIFEWYAVDFGGSDAVAAYLSRYSGKDYSEYSMSFIEYDWSINEAK